MSVEYAWLLQDLNAGENHGLVFHEEHMAMHAAERIVGNRSYAVIPDGLIYGPGDGTTRVMVRYLTLDTIKSLGHNIPERIWP